jgi:hypothetical protein
VIAAVQASQPIIVKLVEPHQTNVADVLIGALGVTGVLVVIAAIAGLLAGGLLFWIRARQRSRIG